MPGNSLEIGQTVKFRRDGGLLVAGTDFKYGTNETMTTTPHAYRAALPYAFVAHYTGGGRLVWRAALGPTRRVNPGSSDYDPGDDFAITGLSFDTNNAVYVSGLSVSPHAPTTPGTAQKIHASNPDATPNADGYVAKLTADGRRIVWATYLGGSNTDGFVAAAVSSRGSVWVLGETTSENFPRRHNLQPTCHPGKSSNQNAQNVNGDVVVAQLDLVTGKLRTSTCIGGSARDDVNLGRTEPAADLAVDETGNVYFTGETLSPDYPVRDPWQGFSGIGLVSRINPVYKHWYGDAFVTKLAPNGAIVWSGPLGGSEGELGGGGVAVQGDRVVVATSTSSRDYPGLSSRRKNPDTVTIPVVTSLTNPASSSQSDQVPQQSGRDSRSARLDESAELAITGSSPAMELLAFCLVFLGGLVRLVSPRAG
jgi:hypothetical protein